MTEKGKCIFAEKMADVSDFHIPVKILTSSRKNKNETTDLSPKILSMHRVTTQRGSPDLNNWRQLYLKYSYGIGTGKAETGKHDFMF